MKIAFEWIQKEIINHYLQIQVKLEKELKVKFHKIMPNQIKNTGIFDYYFKHIADKELVFHDETLKDFSEFIH